MVDLIDLIQLHIDLHTTTGVKVDEQFPKLFHSFSMILPILRNWQHQGRLASNLIDHRQLPLDSQATTNVRIEV